MVSNELKTLVAIAMQAMLEDAMLHQDELSSRELEKIDTFYEKYKKALHFSDEEKENICAAAFTILNGGGE